ncbi:hypothetical protein, partial [Erythrobacter sp. HI0074]
QNLMATLSDRIDRVAEAFQAFMDTPLGGFIAEVVDFLGTLLEVLITLAGYVAGEFISAFFEGLMMIADVVGGVV